MVIEVAEPPPFAAARPSVGLFLLVLRAVGLSGGCEDLRPG